MQKFGFLLVPAFLLLSLSAPALAHHPGADLDAAMGDKEKYFQVIDEPAPGFDLVDAEGTSFRLSDFADKIVVLNFIYADCPDVCPLHSEKIADIQSRLNESPMRDMVRFVTVTTDPARDTAEVMRGYGEAHGLDPVNWTFLTRRQGQPEDVTRALARAYGMEFTETDDGLQMHGVVTHVIDRNGRLAAKFHGLRFASVNLILYVNGLINNGEVSERPAADKSWWQRFIGWF